MISNVIFLAYNEVCKNNNCQFKLNGKIKCWGLREDRADEFICEFEELRRLEERMN